MIFKKMDRTSLAFGTMQSVTYIIEVSEGEQSVWNNIKICIFEEIMANSPYLEKNINVHI